MNTYCAPSVAYHMVHHPALVELIVFNTYRTLQASSDQLADEIWLVQALKDDFVDIFGQSIASVRCFAAPARINLIGEHIDYNGGRVFPAALDKSLYIAIRKRADDRIVVRSVQLPGEYCRSLTLAGQLGPETSYGRYMDGILTLLQRRGACIDCGFEILLFSTVPMSAGVSSSAALELCFAKAVVALFNYDIELLELVKLTQLAEHEFVGVMCGIMDQFAVAFGRRGQAMLLNTATLEYKYVPLELGKHCIVLINSNYPRNLSESKYNERRQECEQGLAMLQRYFATGAGGQALRQNPPHALCDLDPEQFEASVDALTDPVIRRRVRHCVYENQRVLRSMADLEAGRLADFGQLMKESHISLRDDYEVSGAALDAIYDAAADHPACLGVRMTGAGFGGCAIALVERAAAPDFIAALGPAYTARTGLTASFYITEAGDGARELGV